MGKTLQIETTCFAGFAVLLIASAAIAVHVGYSPASSRTAYGLAHLAPALAMAGLFSGAVAFGYTWLQGRTAAWLESQPTELFLTLIGAVFCFFWLPVLVRGGFVQDDWLLLAAASVRHVIAAHPATSLQALDAVDGNFRPLGTVLYFSYLYRLVGLSPHVYLLGNFLLCLGAAMTAFLIVREMGYSKVTAAMGATLYLSRGVIYMQAAWISALGDCIVTLLTGLVVLLVLKAMRREDAGAWWLHAGAWALFALSTLAKQSSFTTPMMVVALLLVRPGRSLQVAWTERWKQAAGASAAYGAVVVAIYLHARMLLGNQTPYHMGLSLVGVLRTFAYVFWYFETLYAPSSRLVARSHPAVLFDVGGILLAVCVGVLVWRRPRLLGERPRDLVFLLIAGVASVSLFVLLEGRNEAYYGAMLAFWFSLGFAILLTRVQGPGPRRMAAFLFSGLVAVGCLDVRLKEIGLVWTGGYFWGDADVHAENAAYAELRKIAEHRPGGRTAVLIDPPIQPRFYTAMLYLIDPGLERVLVYDSVRGEYLGNDREGRRPEDGVPALRDVGAYKAMTPVAAERVADVTSGGTTVWIRYSNGGFREIEGDAVQARVRRVESRDEP